MSDIKPALTAEEWEGWSVGSMAGRVTVYDFAGQRLRLTEYDNGGERESDLGSAHALAALALAEQPFGFTPEDVELVREFGNRCIQEADDHTDVQEEIDYGKQWLNLADRIEALLPPED